MTKLSGHATPHFVPARARPGITIMRALLAIAALLLTGAAALADPPKLAVFDFELIDTSLPGEFYGSKPEEARLVRISEQLRKELAESGKFQVLDIAPVREAARHANLQACGGCDLKLAGQLGADLEITGLVQKVSNLIINLNVYLRDVKTGNMITAASADMRGNTDESWSRTMSYLIRNRLLAPNYGKP
ncbi:DUF3280 domain-containing protein [Bradyrhizobium sp. DASA03005]|uniref:DUF3280 domain-containing protein n=1 Tax=Bradyrhizobium TaxID=374 RepID=UPI00155F3BE0|nr:MULTISPECIES: DUF3280 domain-containing protein [Bradyrhizobium]MBR1167180.1 DUF3280 domain-containing protein [Bradyrhizobium liaoningense]MDD1518635.1 hypothetical protein [Bradyrhizobium sp. WBAH30]MDD1542433.1 hypothetical protein [Bradyrhizobium sp. WBAH41]MDD1556585.1 hypothetical protein [Bradyrhizobium sp. WBAH23]MDD1561574.1 hypothetical protein [Bradyrhizobium sp. WBAH33]